MFTKLGSGFLALSSLSPSQETRGVKWCLCKYTIPCEQRRPRFTGVKQRGTRWCEVRRDTAAALPTSLLFSSGLPPPPSWPDPQLGWVGWGWRGVGASRLLLGIGGADIKPLPGSNKTLEDERCSFSICMLCYAIMSDSLQPCGLQPARLLCPWDSPGKKTGVDSHFLLQGNFPNQGLNLRLLRFLHWQAGSLPLSHQWSPYICNIAVTFLRRFNVYPPQFSDVNGHLLENVIGYKNSPIVIEFSTSLCLVWPLNAPLFKLIVDQGLSMSWVGLGAVFIPQLLSPLLSLWDLVQYLVNLFFVPVSS